MTGVIPQQGTSHLTAEGFMAQFIVTLPGQSFVYARGDLAVACNRDPIAHKLRAAAWRLYTECAICLTQRACAPESFAMGGRAFDYIATKRAPRRLYEESAGT